MSGCTRSFLSSTSPAMQAALGIWHARSATADAYDEYEYEDEDEYKYDEEDRKEADPEASAGDGEMSAKDRAPNPPAHIREDDRKEGDDARPHTLRPKI